MYVHSTIAISCVCVCVCGGGGVMCVRTQHAVCGGRGVEWICVCVCAHICCTVSCLFVLLL